MGAGLGGIAFGLSLLKLCEEHNVRPLPEVHLFERDSSEDAQTGHGYSLGVRSDSGGLQVIRECAGCPRIDTVLTSCYSVVVFCAKSLASAIAFTELLTVTAGYAAAGSPG